MTAHTIASSLLGDAMPVFGSVVENIIFHPSPPPDAAS